MLSICCVVRCYWYVKKMVEEEKEKMNVVPVPAPRPGPWNTMAP